MAGEEAGKHKSQLHKRNIILQYLRTFDRHRNMSFCSSHTNFVIHQRHSVAAVAQKCY